MIQIENLSKRYGKNEILRQITVRFESGGIYGLVGANGCGKTTLMRCICGFSKAADFAPKTGVIIESPGFLPNESGLTNLMLLADMSGRADRADARRAMETLGLSPDERKPVGRYSLGMRQRLGFAQAIMENPDVLVLDEPFNAMDRDAMEEVHALLRQFREAGKTILLASHSAADIAKACDIVYEMEDGRLRRAVPAERN